jgi:hypothetical protein
MRANFVVRGTMANGRFSDAYGSCDRGACALPHARSAARADVRADIPHALVSCNRSGEKRFMAPNRDVPATAETRASSRAIQNLLGIND